MSDQVIHIAGQRFVVVGEKLVTSWHSDGKVLMYTAVVVEAAE